MSQKTQEYAQQLLSRMVFPDMPEEDGLRLVQTNIARFAYGGPVNVGEQPEYEDFGAQGQMPEYGQEPVQLFNEGGEVEEPNLLSVPTYSRTVSYEMYPGQEGQFDQRDAARHMLASGTLARKYGPTAAEMLGKLHEIGTSPMRFIGSKLGISEMPVDYEQDLHNNRIGIELAKRSKNQKELEDLIQQMAEQAQGQRVEGKAWTGRPANRQPKR